MVSLPCEKIIESVNQVWSGGSAICDIIIASSMLYYLRKTRKSVRGRASIALITRLLKLTVETGLLCAVVMTSALVMFVTGSGNAWYMVPALTACKLYSNSLLVVGLLQAPHNVKAWLTSKTGTQCTRSH